MSILGEMQEGRTLVVYKLSCSRSIISCSGGRTLCLPGRACAGFGLGVEAYYRLIHSITCNKIRSRRISSQIKTLLTPKVEHGLVTLPLAHKLRHVGLNRRTWIWSLQYAFHRQQRKKAAGRSVMLTWYHFPKSETKSVESFPF